MTVPVKTFPKGTWIVAKNFVLKGYITCKHLYSICHYLNVFAYMNMYVSTLFPTELY